MTSPKSHRLDVGDVPALVEMQHLRNDHDVHVASSGTSQHVFVAHRRTNDHDGQVVVVLSPRAAKVLGLVLQRFTNMFSRPMMGGLEDYDAGMWQSVSMALLSRGERASAAPPPDLPFHGRQFSPPADVDPRPGRAPGRRRRDMAEVSR